MTKQKQIKASLDEIVEAVKKQKMIISELSDESVMCITGNELRTALAKFVVEEETATLRAELDRLKGCDNLLMPDPNSKRNWEEDYQYENGNYLNECTYCYKPFLGIKNRTCCKMCYERL